MRVCGKNIINPHTGKRILSWLFNRGRQSLQITFSQCGVDSVLFGTDMTKTPDCSKAQKVFMNRKGLPYSDM